MSMTEKTATELLSLQKQGQLTAVAIAESFLANLERHEPAIRAFLHVPKHETIIEQARQIDAKRQSRQPLGLLAGIPIAIKDLFCTRTMPTTCASKMLSNYLSPYNATVVERLQSADAIIIGKTNMDEFAMGSSTENSAYQKTTNPWNTAHTPGGSSGGSAAAVAARQASIAVGTDTGGSIRQPASHCGVVGVKPSYGRVSRYGMVAYASSLDQAGPLARDVTDAALLLEVIAGHDHKDSTSVRTHNSAFSQTVDQPIEKLTIGVPREFFDAGLDGEVRAAVQEALAEFRRLGATIIDISLPHSPYAVATYYLVATAEASSNLARYDGMHFGFRATTAQGLIPTMCQTRTEGFGPEVRRRIILGTYALSTGYKDAYYLKALKTRRLIKNDFDQAFQKCDVILGPTTPTAAFRLGEKIDDPLTMYLSDIYTISCNLAGLPGLSLPCGFTKAGLPIGLQIIAAPFEEEKMLRAARMYEKTNDFRYRQPSC